MVQWVESLATSRMTSAQPPGPACWKERPGSRELSSDFHMHSTGHQHCSQTRIVNQSILAKSGVGAQICKLLRRLKQKETAQLCPTSECLFPLYPYCLCPNCGHEVDNLLLSYFLLAKGGTRILLSITGQLWTSQIGSEPQPRRDTQVKQVTSWHPQAPSL